MDNASSSSIVEELSAPPSPSVISSSDDDSTDEATLSPSPTQHHLEAGDEDDEIDSTPTTAGASLPAAVPPPPPTSHPLDRVGSGGSMVLDPPEPAAPEQQAESRKLPSSQYKGVVPQPNGRWGAQIYEKHQRVWLGTFNEEAEAARAYDVAAQRFRGRDAVTNFKPLSDASESDAAELYFLGNHSKAEIVDMLRKHTYYDELQQSRRRYQLQGGPGGAGAHHLNGLHRRGGLRGMFSSSSAACREQLFDKAVTPSDVGKLNRLVIPKQHAEKHFPLQISGSAAAAAACKGVLLNFEDAAGKVWRFRYSYWNSSQSYVLTKGWSRFVKEKSLQPGDVVSFHRSTGPDRQLFIDCKPRSTLAPASAKGAAAATGYFLTPAPTSGTAIHRGQPLLRSLPPVQTVRLFGVNIAKVPASGAAAPATTQLGGWLEKRKPVEEMDMFPNQHCKKQCVGAAL